MLLITLYVIDLYANSFSIYYNTIFESIDFLYFKINFKVQWK